MKKYILILLGLAFIVSLFSLNISSVSAQVSVDSGCIPGGLYSATTGQPCGAVSQAGCAVGNLFSATTGLPCSLSQMTTTVQVPTIFSILPAGCTTNIGYSSTTGESCANSRSTAKFGETVYMFGSNFSSDYYPVTYSTVSGDFVNISTRVLSSSLMSFVVPSSAGTGQHGILLKKRNNNYFSSNTVVLNFDSNVVSTGTPIISSILPPGCSSNIGYSSTTGEPCTNNRYYANLGDTIYVYGSGFNLTANIFIDGGSYSPVNGVDRLIVPATFITSNLIRFVFPVNAGSGQHRIQVNVQADQNSILSNAVDLSLDSTVNNVATIITSSPFPNAKAGVYYSTDIDGSGDGNTSNFEFMGGPFPGNLTLVPDNVGSCGSNGLCHGSAKLSGTPLTAGTYNFTVFMFHGNQSAQKTYTLTVEPVASSAYPTISSLSQYSGTVGTKVVIYGNGFATGPQATTNRSGKTIVDQGENNISFGSATISGVTSLDGRSLTFIVPSYSNLGSPVVIGPGTYGVLVNNVNGASNQIPFTVVSSTVSTPPVTTPTTTTTTTTTTTEPAPTPMPTHTGGCSTTKGGGYSSTTGEPC